MASLMKNATRSIFFVFILCMTVSCQKSETMASANTEIFLTERFAVFEGKLSDGRPAVGNVNLAYSDFPKKYEYPWCLELNIALDESRLFENGLPKQEESTIANRFEDDLMAEIRKRSVAHYVGHVYNDGFLDVYVYLDKPKEVHDYLQTQINREELTRPFRYEIKEDANWTTVETFLKVKK